MMKTALLKQRTINLAVGALVSLLGACAKTASSEVTRETKGCRRGDAHFVTGPEVAKK